MLLDKGFQSFLKERPICVMAQAVLMRILDPYRVNELFDRTAEQQYEQIVVFSEVTRLMADVVFRIQPSINAAYQSNNYDLGISRTALYNKIDNVEPRISAELVRDSAAGAAPIIDELHAQFEPWLPGFRCRILDGNHLAATEHRLEPLRTTLAAPLPGKVLAILDPQRMLVEDVVLTEDGHAQERSLIDEVIPKAKAKDLWIADRNFCTKKFMASLMDIGAFFLFRQHGSLQGTLVGRPRSKGRTETGKVYEQTLKVHNNETGEDLVLRRVTVKLDKPTRDGDTEIHLLTNVPVKKANAKRLADLYRKRWTIEGAFGEITSTLSCEIDTLCYPKAALFSFCLALLAYNAVAVLKAALRSAHGQEKVGRDISPYYLALELQQSYDGMMVALPLARWEVFREMSVVELASWLKATAQGIQWSRYQKHSRGPKKKPLKKEPYKHGGHVSTMRVLQKTATEQVSC